MKRIGYLYDNVCDIDNLRLAHKHARRGKSWYAEVKKVDRNPDKYLHAIQDMLVNKTFETSDYEIFDRMENGKLRTIYKLPYYPDRIVQWALIQVIEPYILNTMTADTYSAIPDRGIHQALSKVKQAAKRNEYCLQMDVHHYYQSIDHELLKESFQRLFKDPDLLWLIGEIIDSIDTNDQGKSGVGIPIGNYLSQYCGNLFLSPIDHMAKEHLHCRDYFRYMDDIVLFANDKQYLHDAKAQIESKLHDMKLLFKPNWRIYPIECGVDFLGYVTYPSECRLRRGIADRYKRKMRNISKHETMTEHDVATMASYNGWLSHCNAGRLQCKYDSMAKGAAL